MSARQVFPGDLLAEFLERAEAGGPLARLEAMTADQLKGAAASGWHCGFPRCAAPALYLSSLRYAMQDREHQRGRLLCEEHAARFAVRHSIDLPADAPDPGRPETWVFGEAPATTGWHDVPDPEEDR